MANYRNHWPGDVQSAFVGKVCEGPGSVRWVRPSIYRTVAMVPKGNRQTQRSMGKCASLAKEKMCSSRSMPAG
jgi:hypothetical protein